MKFVVAFFLISFTAKGGSGLVSEPDPPRSVTSYVRMTSQSVVGLVPRLGPAGDVFEVTFHCLSHFILVSFR